MLFIEMLLFVFALTSLEFTFASGFTLLVLCLSQVTLCVLVLVAPVALVTIVRLD